MLKLEDWYHNALYESNYSAPETGDLVLNGIVYGHPRFPDGTYVHTSRLIAGDYERGLVRTYSGSLYTLGKMRESYKAYRAENNLSEVPVSHGDLSKLEISE